ncbi:hypothetical protein [Methanospirillum sp.]
MVKKEGEDGWRREEGLEIRWAARAESVNGTIIARHLLSSM